MHVVAHTHWDREWYRPASQFRQRLVLLIDEVLDDASAAPFLLDGQAVVLEDYLDIRPERAADVSARLRAGSLEAGPWFTLPDELIPGGEALIRNLLAGRRVLRRLRAEPPPVLYCPDSFGHPAALPALALGFGSPVVVVWRGYGGKRWPSGDTVRWRAADGSTALLCHLPRDGYEFGSHLPVDDAGAHARAARIAAELKPRSALGIVLLPHGADHHAPQDGQPGAIGALARALPDDDVRRSSLVVFGGELREAAARRRLPLVEGELRDSYGYTWTLGGTLSTRAAQKRRYAIAERLLVRDVEPWAALRWMRDRRSRRALLDAAWRPLLLVHPHDTLCGCSIDEVARAADARIEEAAAAGESLRDEALDALVGHDPVAARGREAEWSPVVVVRNRSARRRGGVAEIDVDTVLAEAPVGPGSAQATVERRPPPSSVSLGNPPVLVQTMGGGPRFAREESPRHYPRNRLVQRHRVLAWLDAVPAFGLRLLPVGDGRRRGPRLSERARASKNEIGNARLRVGIANHSLVLTAPDGSILPAFLGFEAEGERGDLYTPSRIEGTRARAALLRARVSARGPLRAEIATMWEAALPGRRLTSAVGEPREAPAARIRFYARLQVDASAPFVRVVITGESGASDMRLRASVRTSVADPEVHADAAFGPVARRPIAVDAEDARMELPVSGAPLHRYVTLSNATQGWTIFSDGLAEYEAARDGTLSVTLRRAVGELSRADLPERPGHAGWPAETPGAQEHGRFEAMLALMPHGPRRAGVIAAVENAADDVLLPLAGHTWRTAVAPPAFVEGVQLAGRGLAFSAMKESENGEWTVLRCVNLLDEPVSGAWRLPSVREAFLARLDETPLAARSVQNGVISFEAPPRAMVTLLVR
jgi:hypothetical protein